MHEQTDVTGFYGALATGYDAMTGFTGRLAAATRFLQGWQQQRPACHRLLDLATGTGVYAIAAAQLGMKATGSDLSPEMLAAAADNARAAGVSIPWVTAHMEDLPLTCDGQFDTALCLGNSLPHLLDDAVLTRALARFHAVLAPGGAVMIQLLNYQRILANQERVISVDRQDQTEFVRFYDFLPDGLLRFNLLRVEWQPGKETKTALQSVHLHPWCAPELTDALHRAGFTQVRAFGGLDFSPWQAETSETLLLVGEF